MHASSPSHSPVIKIRSDPGAISSVRKPSLGNISSWSFIYSDCQLAVARINAIPLWIEQSNNMAEILGRTISVSIRVEPDHLFFHRNIKYVVKRSNIKRVSYDRYPTSNIKRVSYNRYPTSKRLPIRHYFRMHSIDIPNPLMRPECDSMISWRFH